VWVFSLAAKEGKKLGHFPEGPKHLHDVPLGHPPHMPILNVVSFNAP